MKMTTFRKKSKSLLTILLTIGAGLTLGLLSMSGLLAVIPIVSLGLASFVLSVMYEGEIYWENLVDAIKRMTQKDYHHLEHTKRFISLILEQIPESKLPTLLKRYKRLPNEEGCSHHQTEEERDKQRELLERYIMQALFDKDPQTNDPLFLELNAFFNTVEVSEQDKTLNKAKFMQQVNFRARASKIALYLSMSIGAFFGLGTLFLLSEAMTVLGLSIISAALLPYIVIPLCVLSAAAYSLLIFNTLANIIQHNSLKKWGQDIYDDFLKKPSFTSVLRGLGALTLITMGLALTIFTAGTWWTVANNVPKAIPFLKKIPKVVTLFLIPLFTSLGALFFNMENTRASMALFRPSKKVSEDKKVPAKTNQSWFKRFFKRFWQTFKQDFILPFKKLREKESAWQFYNPFRIFLFCIEFPIKVLAFIGHLISIGATTDQIPGIPVWLAMVCSAVSEGLEDFHYFFSFESHGHSHDLPSNVIKFALSPLFFLSALWNYAFSKDDFKTSWHKSWQHAWYEAPKEKSSAPEQEESIAERAENIAVAKALATMQLDSQIKRYQHDSEKQKVYINIKEDIKNDKDGKNVSSLIAKLSNHESDYMKVLKTQRNRFFQPKTTSSQDFIEELKGTLSIKDPKRSSQFFSGCACCPADDKPIDMTKPFGFITKKPHLPSTSIR